MPNPLRRRLILLLLLGIAWNPLVSDRAAAARVTDIRWGSHEGFSRCVVEFNGSPARAVLENRIADLGMLYCDLYGTTSDPIKGVQAVGDPNIQSIQTVYVPSEKKLRLAVKLGRRARPSLMTLNNPGRVVIDFYWQTGGDSGSSSSGSATSSGSISGLGARPSTYMRNRSAQSSAASSRNDSRPEGASLWSRQGTTGIIPGGGSASPSSQPAQRAAVVTPRSRKPIVVVDPGHGGWHKGAVGHVNGRTVYEKTITLQIAWKVKAKLEARGNVEVKLTRTKDVYVGLFERTQIAEKDHGDLFVSIHCNSTDDRAASRHARGVEFWYWNKNSSTSAAARYLEKLENDEGHSDGIAGAAPTTRRLIGSLMADQLESMALRSADVCKTFSRAFDKISYFRKYNRGIKSARFKVLETYQMPSILVEVGFLSHPTEARYLVTDHFQDMIADSLARGIERTVENLKKE